MDSLPNSKLVEVCNKLVSGNTMLQYQALSRVYTMIKDYSNNEVEKKRTVLKLMDSFRSIKARNCCLSLLKILVKLSIENLIEYSLLINSFLSLINSKAENSTYCLDFISDLLINYQDECIKKYSLRNPTHPFVDILRNSDNNLNELIFHQIDLIYQDKRIDDTKASKLLKPVFIYIFLECENLKHLIGNFLVKKLINQSNEQIINLIIFYLKSLKKSDLRDALVFETIGHISKLYTIDDSFLDKINISDLINLIIQIDIDQNLNFSNQWNFFTNLLCQKDSNIKKKIINSDLMEILASNISKISLINLESYLNFVGQCINDYQGNSKLDLAIFFPNLFLYAVSLGVFDSIDLFNSHRSLISNLISKIELKLTDSIYEPLNMCQTNLFNLVEYEDNNPTNEDLNEKVNKNFLNRLSAHFISNENDLILNQKICSIFKQLTLKWPNLYGIFFSLYIYKMRVSSNCDIINYLINSITDLIGPKIDINLCLNILKSLMNSSSEENMIVRLNCMKQLTKLCTMKYDYLVYPHLSNELVSIKNLQLAEKHRIQVLYMKAYCIYEIISYRPDYYAQELLATISNLLNQCVQKNDEGICAILMDSLSFLCESEVVDMLSTWNALLPQFKNEKRVLVLNSYSRFMSVASKLKHLESENQDSFYMKMLKMLWKLSDPEENLYEEKWTIISAALRELSKFNKISFKCSFLPKFIQEKIKERNRKIIELEENKEKSIDEIFPRIPSNCYIDYFQSLKPAAYDGLSDLFKSILTEEIDSIPRRSVSFAKEKVFSQDEQQMAQKDFYEHIKNFLVEEYKNCFYLIENSNQKIDVGYVLFCYDAPCDRNLDGKIFKKHIKSYWKSYELTLILILEKGSFDLSEENLDFYTKGFNRLINRSYNACIQAFNFEFQSGLDEKLGHDQVEKNRQNLSNVWKMARDRHLEILTESYKKRADQTSDNLFLIVLNSLIETSTEYIKLNLNNDENSVYNQRKWLEVLVDFILNIKENKTTSESEYINMFSYKQAHSVESLKVLFKIYQNSNLISYFLASVLPSCVYIKISSFLIQYIHRIQIELLEKQSLESNDLKSISIYLKNLMNLESEFRMEQNSKINENFEKLMIKFRTQLNSESNIIDAYLNVFVDCLNKLYNEESIYYDDKNILEQLVSFLNENLETPFFDINKSAMSSLVNLTCLAYKSNLIKNENLIHIYEILNKESRYNFLLALFCRFLISYGFYDSVEWIENSYSKWMKYYNDFKLNLNDDLVELEYCFKGILTLLTGVSTDCSNFDQDTFLPVDLEKFLKPQSTIKDLIKFFKNNKDSLTNLNKNLAFILDRFNQTKFGEIYSTPNSYDYLDDFSLLKHIVNELLRLSKMKIPTDNTNNEFEFFVKVLLESCLNSNCKILPPLNWYYFMTSLIKSRFGTKLESKLVKLTMMQINNLNSAYSLLKNYLVDTNYFMHLKPESQSIVLEHLIGILDRFNLTLIKKFINKLKLFLKQIPREETNVFIHKILSNIFEYISRDKEGSNEVLREVVNFFAFLSKDFNYKPTCEQDVKILDQIVSIIEKLQDNELMKFIVNLEDIIPVDERFMMIFYIRNRLVLKQYQSFMLINEPIDLMVKYYDTTNGELQCEFVNLFAKFLLDISYKEFEYSKNQSTVNKSNILKNNSLNWLMDFMNNAKLLTNKNLQFSIQLFSVIIYCWSNQSIDLYDMKTCFINNQQVLKNISINLQKFTHHPFWKQIHLKLIDWLIYIIGNNSFSPMLFNYLFQSLIILYKDTQVSDDLWYKYANLINTKILSD